MNELSRLAEALQNDHGTPIRLMEVCGTHTHALSRFGIPALLPPHISLLSGPGCPVCVTPAAYIDRAAELAAQPGCTLLSFGDMLRVPGNRGSLLEAKAAGASVVLMYSPLDALRHAAGAPDRLFYVTAVGFETTLPLYALLIQRLRERGLRNVRLLTAARALLPALRWLCAHNPEIDGFIGPGHASTILGWGGYGPLCEASGLPLTVAGFGYEQLLAALYDLIRQVRRDAHEVHNLYPGAVTREGNLPAQALIAQYFVLEPSRWRGLGVLPDSGYRLATAYADYDAGGYPDVPGLAEAEGCQCGAVLTGHLRPVDCPLFGATCTPARPMGPCMVSSEGACGIWHATTRTR